MIAKNTDIDKSSKKPPKGGVSRFKIQESRVKTIISDHIHAQSIAHLFALLFQLQHLPRSKD